MPETCAQCGKTRGEPLDHRWQEADCENPKTCTVCGVTEGEPLGHRAGEPEITRDFPHAEETSRVSCTVCGGQLSEEVLPMTLVHNGEVFLFTPQEFFERCSVLAGQMGLELQYLQPPKLDGGPEDGYRMGFYLSPDRMEKFLPEGMEWDVSDNPRLAASNCEFWNESFRDTRPGTYQTLCICLTNDESGATDMTDNQIVKILMPVYSCAIYLAALNPRMASSLEDMNVISEEFLEMLTAVPEAGMDGLFQDGLHYQYDTESKIMLVRVIS